MRNIFYFLLATLFIIGCEKDYPDIDYSEDVSFEIIFHKENQNDTYKIKYSFPKEKKDLVSTYSIKRIATLELTQGFSLTVSDIIGTVDLIVSVDGKEYFKQTGITESTEFKYINKYDGNDIEP